MGILLILLRSIPSQIKTKYLFSVFFYLFINLSLKTNAEFKLWQLLIGHLVCHRSRVVSSLALTSVLISMKANQNQN